MVSASKTSKYYSVLRFHKIQKIKGALSAPLISNILIHLRLCQQGNLAIETADLPVDRIED